MIDTDRELLRSGLVGFGGSDRYLLQCQQAVSQQQSNLLAIAQQQATNQQALNRRAQSSGQAGLGALGQFGGAGGSAFGALHTQLGQAASQNCFTDPTGGTVCKSVQKVIDKDRYNTSFIDRLLYYKSRFMLSIGERIIDYCGD